MKKIYYTPTAQFEAISLCDVITSSANDDWLDDIFGGASNNVPHIED